MTPENLGQKYDRIAQWWQDRHKASDYGVAQVQLALTYLNIDAGRALDVGCGAGGRLVQLMMDQGLAVTGVDVSKEMIALAKVQHSTANFHHQNIQEFDSPYGFDFILAWDSLFHLPLASQVPVLQKLCGLLRVGGVLSYSFGNAIGDHMDQWHGDEFYYSSVGIRDNVTILRDVGLSVRHMELDQFPQNHVFLIAVKEG